ncbi:MAG: NUDIX domain-containing protein [Gemmatimonadales bacterium]|nr:NUDIX domain-containing protein [Gemmatimonadales bacterium]NIN12724.1 NUDIX domain-containing protein [Gemmatimonadales bacterium]NIQ99615.1 NUDIX domain-containing protein [Gemmatimonadales bacterium]NIS64172.1 NUDIX domain-containing protein [Gemmatimonadales bacterium]
MTTIPVSEVLGLLDTFDAAGDERAAASARRTVDLLRQSPAPFSRTSYDLGHVTASALVLSSDGTQVLLVFHHRLQRWLQPGGHVESHDASIVAAAQREVREETGLAVLPTTPLRLVGVDVHEIPSGHGEPAHLHHDLMVRCSADGDPGNLTGENHATWCPVHDLSRYRVDQALHRGVARALAGV